MSAAPDTGSRRPAPFEVHLDGFDGPFDLLLGLIASHELDVTRISLARVTDEFLAHVRAMDAAGEYDLDRVSEFVVVAATLLDLKAARLLPRGEVEDAEDVAALEAREMLFVRLLQYRAYKRVADWFGSRFATQGVRVPAAVGAGPEFADVLPAVLLGLDAIRFGELAARVFTPRPPPEPDTSHLHAPAVSVAEQSRLVAARLRDAGPASFADLVGGEPVAVLVARFLALLELFRAGRVRFSQADPLGPLTVAWDGDAAVAAPVPASEFDAGPDSGSDAGTLRGTDDGTLGGTDDGSDAGSDAGSGPRSGPNT